MPNTSMTRVKLVYISKEEEQQEEKEEELEEKE